jgi:2-desacetyl-2-hydroxyethyl bacteriochlorophyllide A dehydrogenase
MRQIVLERPGKLTPTDATPPAAGAGEALVRVRRVGVCGTDFHAFHGEQPYFTYPRVLGHELAVEVVEAFPNDRGISAGDACAVEPYLNCGACPPCRAGRYNCCESVRVLGVHTDGGMREFFAVPLDHLHKSSTLSFDELVLVEPLSIAAHAVKRSGLAASETVLVIGAGPIGFAVTQVAIAAGARPRVVEVAPARRDRIARLGMEVLSEADERLADVVFDATGNLSSMAESLSRVAFGGRVVWVGLAQGKVSLDDPLFHRREVTLLASRNSAGQFPRVIRMIEEGRIDTSHWITRRLELEDVPALFDDLAWHREGLKTMVEVGK